jgi:hypothetical protein
MGRRRSEENSTPQNTNNSIGDLVGNEQKEYAVPNPNRIIINDH